MGNLPKERVTQNFVFQNCGCDFAGPFLITDRKGRGCKITKCYLCLFVCFSTKAVHLEVASDLSKDIFILCLKRFISRRGRPSQIFCDNATNFVGASNEIGKFIQDNCTALADSASSEGIKFVFSPAYAPNFGGLWEAGVKSAKYHIKRVLGDTHLTFEELSTLFAQVESILNSRPITPLSSDIHDLEPLTPGHILIGRPLTSFLTPELREVNPNRLDSFQRIESYRQHFWNRWHHCYLKELQQRSKWRTPQQNLKIGDLVILHELNQPPLKWRLGRVHRVFPGLDGVNRVADFYTTKGIIRRAINKTSPLLPALEQTSIEEDPRT